MIVLNIMITKKKYKTLNYDAILIKNLYQLLFATYASILGVPRKRKT